MFKRILVAVDGSDTAEQALLEAINLAKEHQAQLRIVHAVDIPEFPQSSEISGAMTKNGREILRKAEAVARGAMAKGVDLDQPGFDGSSRK